MNPQETYQTQNLPLAVTLFTAGVPIPVNGKGKPCPGHNIYDVDVLKNLGIRGLRLEAAVERAFNNGKGKPGIEVFNFVKCDLLQEILEAFDEQQELIKKADQRAGLAGSEGTTDIQVSGADMARICCQYAKNRKLYVNMWRKLIPQIAIHGEQKTGTDEKGRKTITGSLKLVQLGASNETKRKAGL